MAIQKSLPASQPAGLQRWTGFKDKLNFRYYAFLSTVSVAFIAWMFRAVFVESVYCNPNNNAVRMPLGECYWYLQPGSRYYWGIQLHLAACFPAMALAVLQFTPKIRQTYPIYHRWAGRAVMVLGIITTITALLFVDIVQGGTMSTISAVLTLAAMSLLGHYKGWVAIRSGAIHDHRRWMLRTWGWLGCIITMRVLVAPAVLLVTKLKDLFPLSMNVKKDEPAVNIFTEYAQACMRPEYLATNLTYFQGVVSKALANQTRAIPPIVVEALNPDGVVSVQASLASRRTDNIVAAVSVTFDWAIWAAMAIHFVVVELYISRTKEENDRLKRVSEMRQANGTKIKTR